jgi:hypothetical protein
MHWIQYAEQFAVHNITHHLSHIWITIHHMYLLYTKLHRTTLQTRIFNCSFFTLLTVSSFNGNFNQNYMIFNFEVNLTHYKYLSVHTTLKMST